MRRERNTNRHGTAAAVVVLLLLGAGVAAAEVDDFFRRGYEASTARNWQEAIDWYTRSINEHPDNPETYFQRGINFEMLDQLPQAVADYQTALKLKPDMYLAMEYLAKVFERQGNYAAAADIYAKALPLIGDPRWRGIVQKWLADAKEQTKKPDHAPKPDDRKRPLF